MSFSLRCKQLPLFLMTETDAFPGRDISRYFLCYPYMSRCFLSSIKLRVS